MTVSTKIIGAFVAIFSLALIVNTTTVQTASAACVDHSYSKEKRSKGTCVRYIQQMLNGQTKYNGQDPIHASPLAGLPLLKTDGIFGKNTKSRVIVLQKWQKISAKGVVNKKTWIKLCSVTMDAYYEISDPLVTTAYKAGKKAGCAKLGAY